MSLLELLARHEVLPLKGVGSPEELRAWSRGFAADREDLAFLRAELARTIRDVGSDPVLEEALAEVSKLSLVLLPVIQIAVGDELDEPDTVREGWLADPPPVGERLPESVARALIFESFLPAALRDSRLRDHWDQAARWLAASPEPWRALFAALREYAAAIDGLAAGDDRSSREAMERFQKGYAALMRPGDHEPELAKIHEQFWTLYADSWLYLADAAAARDDCDAERAALRDWMRYCTQTERASEMTPAAALAALAAAIQRWVAAWPEEHVEAYLPRLVRLVHLLLGAAQHDAARAIARGLLKARAPVEDRCVRALDADRMALPLLVSREALAERLREGDLESARRIVRELRGAALGETVWVRWNWEPLPQRCAAAPERVLEALRVGLDRTLPLDQFDLYRLTYGIAAANPDFVPVRSATLLLCEPQPVLADWDWRGEAFGIGAAPDIGEGTGSTVRMAILWRLGPDDETSACQRLLAILREPLAQSFPEATRLRDYIRGQVDDCLRSDPAEAPAARPRFENPWFDRAADP
ncbi:MAG: hypothetical protein EA420_16335 [Candidatus Competibacteraceae bacterium]|nr:MAG: hypothetical protein EA420_16335 [Candidatus Competibacteraceae bacterium]